MHRFFLSDEEKAKRVARALQAELVRVNLHLGLKTCLDVVAELYGATGYPHLYERGTDLQSWLIYNKSARGGNSLFVDGEYVEGTGSLHGEELARVAKFVLSRELPDTRVRTLKGRWDSDIGARRFGYADDTELVMDWEAAELMEEFLENESTPPAP